MEQSAKATRLIERELTDENPGFVSVVAIAETAWVLERSYGLGSRKIAAAIEAMLQIGVLSLEYEQEVFAATVVVKAELGSFADALVAELGRRAGCRSTLTFDRKASRLNAFELL